MVTCSYRIPDFNYSSLSTRSQKLPPHPPQPALLRYCKSFVPTICDRALLMAPRSGIHTQQALNK